MRPSQADDARSPLPTPFSPAGRCEPDTEGAKIKTNVKATAVQILLMGTPFASARMKMSRGCSPISTGRPDLIPGVPRRASLDRSNFEFQMLAEPQHLYGDGLVDAPAVQQADEVIDSRDLVMWPAQECLGQRDYGARRPRRPWHTTSAALPA
jgi:hypothetical protein